eukprot:2590559-Amphidinium_carterae.2
MLCVVRDYSNDSQSKFEQGSTSQHGSYEVVFRYSYPQSRLTTPASAWHSHLRHPLHLLASQAPLRHSPAAALLPRHQQLLCLPAVAHHPPLHLVRQQCRCPVQPQVISPAHPQPVQQAPATAICKAVEA